MQILKANPNVKSFGQRLNEGIGSGLETLQEYQKMAKEEAKQQKFAKEVERLYAIDVSSMSQEGMEKLATEAYKQNAKFQNQQKLLKELGLEQEQPGFKAAEEKPEQEHEPLRRPEIEKDIYKKPYSKKQLASAALINPALSRIMESENKESFEREKLNRKEEVEFHKETAKYDEDLMKQAKIAKNQNETFKNIESAINSGNVKPTSWANILKGMGPIGDLMGNALLKKDEATLLASIPSLLEGWKDVFGVRLTDADLRVLQDKLPSIGKSPEANRAIINVMRKYSEMTKLRSQISADIKTKNKGLRPLGYAEMIEERFDEMVKPIRIVSPKTGKVIEIPAYKVGDAIKAGATLANE
jgi:biotin carboxyl carrier protein